MGFMDKAKKMAEQAQAKLDEAQKQFNAGQAGGGAPSGEPAVEYDVHGRPVAQAPPASASPPHGDPVAPTEGAPPPTAVPPVPPTRTATTRATRRPSCRTAIRWPADPVPLTAGRRARLSPCAPTKAC